MIGLLRWWHERRHDPAPFQTALAALEQEATLARARAAFDACHVRGEVYWREGLRQLLPHVEPLDGRDGRALLGLVLAHLGEVDRAFAVLDELPADHPAGCEARAAAYEARGDRERAEAARHAARELTRPRPPR